MVIYFLKRDKARDKSAEEREKRLGVRIDTLEDDHRKELVALVGQTTRVIATTNDSNRALNESVRSLVNLMRARPCAWEDQQTYSPQSSYPRGGGLRRTPSDHEIVDPPQPPITEDYGLDPRG